MNDIATGQADLARFLDDPAGYFGHSLTRLMTVPRSELDALQRDGVRARFAQLRVAIPMLERLARQRQVAAVDALEDVVPVLFDHAVYKSYPPSLLDQHRYADLTAWLNRLTAFDLSGVDVSACRSIDDWLLTLARETPLAVCHTTGTSGSLSFLPWAKSEWLRMFGTYPVLFFQDFGDFGRPPARLQVPLNLPCVYPFFRSGGMSHTVANDAIVHIIAGGEERFHAAYPARLSADLLLLGARLKAAAARGRTAVAAGPELAARRGEFEMLQRDMPAHLARFFAEMRKRFAGQRVFVLATSNLLFTMAQNGLAQGISGVFAADSVVVTGGGKGLELPADWRDTVRRFLGAGSIHDCYGMSEMAGQFIACEFGHYHAVPWIVPFVLDPADDRLLPRRGRASGRFAFYDLLVHSRWGGLVTGDAVTLDWDGGCPCGRTAPYLLRDIRRLGGPARDGDDDKVSCADTGETYGEALEFIGQGGDAAEHQGA